jgi:hypothetical protein
MGAFLFGFILGFGIALAVGAGLRPKLLGLLGRGGSLEGAEAPAGVSAAAIRELSVADPGLAGVIAAPAAVPVAAVPEEITIEVQRAIAAAPTPELALAAAKRFVRDADLAIAISTLVQWRTRRRNPESVYQNSFRTTLRRNVQDYAEKPRIPWGGQTGGERIAVPDFIVNQRVLVELKAGLTSSGDSDRALGQMLRYLLAWKERGPAILAICGETSPEIKFLIRMYIRTWREHLNLPVGVYFKQGDDEGAPDEFAEVPEQQPLLSPGDARRY